MSDKPVAAFVAFLFVFPLMVVCCAGPAALSAGAIAAMAWLSQSTLLLALAGIITAGLVLRRLIRARPGIVRSVHSRAGQLGQVHPGRE